MAVGMVLLPGENGRRQYNEVCQGCVHDCMQSFRAVLVVYTRYLSKRSKNCTDEG